MNTQQHLLTYAALHSISFKKQISTQQPKGRRSPKKYSPRITKVHLEVDLPRDRPITEEPEFNLTCTIVHCTTWDTSMLRVQYRTWPKTLGHWCKGGTPPGKRRRSPAALHHPHQYTPCIPMHPDGYQGLITNLQYPLPKAKQIIKLMNV